MILGYYPGCSLEGTSKEYNESVQALAEKFEIKLQEIEDWNCCGATAAHSLNHTLALSLPARILALAENQGIENLLTPCAACFNRLISAQQEFIKNKEVLKEVVDIIEMPYEGKIKIINVIDFIEKFILDKLQPNIVKPFTPLEKDTDRVGGRIHDKVDGGLIPPSEQTVQERGSLTGFTFKSACYYGCLLVRPPKLVNSDRWEDPLVMENILKQIGSTPIDWAYKVECCGAGLSVPRTDIVCKLSGKIIEDAVDRGAEVIVVACPMCHSNLDMRRKDIQRYLKKKYDIPVIYITQAIGLALGMSLKELGISRHLVNAESLIS